MGFVILIVNFGYWVEFYLVSEREEKRSWFMENCFLRLIVSKELKRVIPDFLHCSLTIIGQQENG